MKSVWKEIKNNIQNQPVPPELAQVVDITCVDCEESDTNLGWHFLGVQCRKCSSFNTAVDRIVAKGYKAALLLQNSYYSDYNSS